MKRILLLVAVVLLVLAASYGARGSLTKLANYRPNQNPQKHNTQSTTTPRTFATSFETVSDFSGFFISPQPHLNTTSHSLSSEQVHSGSFSHKAWITGPNPPSTWTVNNNHRGYPTIQFQKTPEGVFKTPVEATFWVWLDMDLKAAKPQNEWFSFATFTSDPTDNWNRTVLANLSYDGFVHLMHVPIQGKAEYIYQTKDLHFPMRQWVKLRVYLDFDGTNGYAKVWQNDVLVSHAKVRGTNGTLAQAHFGMYAAPSVASGVIYNDDLVIREVAGE